MSRDSTPLRAGQKLGRYELLAPVARGGMGQVWAGRLRGARGFHKLVAIKTLLPAAGDSARLEQRLLEEARIAALIQHSNVEQTLELGEHEGTLYLVMEWVDGEPLSDVLAAAHEAGGIPHLIAVNLVAQTLRGLQAAHDLTDEAGQPLGVVHGDVSPSNVLVSYSGIAKLVDFGMAKAMDQRTSFRDHELQDDFSYMAPEQVRGGVVDRRTDLFAVGVMLYVLTTGRHPFAGANSEDVKRAIVSGEPAVRPSLLKPNYSRTLEAVVLKALEKDRERRWHSAEEMRLALQRGVPQAFELGSEAQLRNFMGDTVGDHALRKRDLLRRAELAVDAQLGRPPSGGPASSIASLRAISVDADGRKADSGAPRANHVPARRPSLHSLQNVVWRRRWLRPLALGIAAAAGTVVFGLVWQRPSVGPSPAASSPGAGMVDLSPPRDASVAVRPDASLVPSVLASTRRPGSAAQQDRR